MGEFLTILLYAALPATGNFVGGLLSEIIKPSKRILSLALHAAAGIVIGVVAVELMPQVLRSHLPWVPVASFVAGGLFFVAIDKFVDIVRLRRGSAENEKNPWMLFFSVSMDLFSDGLMIGAGSTVSPSLGLLLALGQVPADLPEGFASLSAFRAKGISRGRRILIGAAFAFPVLIGASIGFWALRGRPEIFKFAVLAFTAGTLTTAVVEEIIPEAHDEPEEPRTAAITFILGFALFALLSVYFE